MFSSYLIDIRDHWSFHHCFDPSTLYSKPRNYQCLYHLQRIKDKNSRLVSLQQTEQEEEEKTKTHSHLVPVLQVQRCSRTVLSTAFYHPANSGRRRRKKSGFMCFHTWCLVACSESVQKCYKASL